MIEAEGLVIGAAVQRPSLIQEIDLTPEDFGQESGQEVWLCLQTMAAQAKAIDLFTVSEEMEKRTGQGEWVAIIGRAMADCVSPGNAKSYAEVVRSQAKVRQIMGMVESLQSADRHNWREVVDSAMLEMISLNAENKRWECGLKDVLKDVLNELDEVHASGNSVGITSGLKDLDEILGGFHPSDLYVIGARPAMGKTSLLLKLAHAPDIPVGLISAEQPRNQIGGRLMAMDAKVHASKMRNADFEEHEWARLTCAMSRLVNKNIRINDKPAPTISDVIRQGRAWAYSPGIKALYVDYIQRIKATDTRQPKHVQVEEVVMGLKELARELNIPVIALAQVNRAVEQRADKRPLMSDLKDSGSIEQEADNVMTLYRDEVYNEDSEHKGKAEIDVVKNRHGPIGFVEVAWIGRSMRFDDLANKEWAA